MNLRPHTMKWTTPGTPGGVEEGTGYPLPDLPGEPRSTPCRFHLENIKVFRNQDNTVTNQVGKIRLDPGVELPFVGQTISVVEETPSGLITHFEGPVKDVYRGQLSYRIDV